MASHDALLWPYRPARGMVRRSIRRNAASDPKYGSMHTASPRPSIMAAGGICHYRYRAPAPHAYRMAAWKHCRCVHACMILGALQAPFTHMTPAPHMTRVWREVYMVSPTGG